MGQAWYHRFDDVLLTPEEDLTPTETETFLWLSAFDDVILGCGRRTRRRAWCETASTFQRHLSRTGRWPAEGDPSVPAKLRSWIEAQRTEHFTVFQQAWWQYLKSLTNGAS